MIQVLYFKIIFMQEPAFASFVYTKAWKMDILSIMSKFTRFKDFACVFHCQPTPAQMILFQHINKDRNLRC